MPQIHLDSDGTEIDDEDYFQTLEPNTELIAVFSGEQWNDVSLIVNDIIAIQRDVVSAQFDERSINKTRGKYSQLDKSPFALNE